MFTDLRIFIKIKINNSLSFKMGACPLCGFTPHGGETAIEVFHYRLNDVSVQSSLAVSHDSEPRLTKAETSQSEMQPSAKDLCFFLLLISQITC